MDDRLRSAEVDGAKRRLLLIADAAGNASWQPGLQGLFDAGVGFDLTPIPMDPGLTVWVMLQVTDAAGNGDVAWLTATL